MYSYLRHQRRKEIATELSCISVVMVDKVRLIEYLSKDHGAYPLPLFSLFSLGRWIYGAMKSATQHLLRGLKNLI